MGRRDRLWRDDDPSTYGLGARLVVICPFCERPIPPGAPQSRHHLVPKMKGGARGETVRLHQICHSFIHANYKESQLAQRFNSIESLRSDPNAAKFIAWLRGKPDGFHKGTQQNQNRRQVSRNGRRR